VNFIDGTIPPVHEIVIVVSDLFLAASQTDSPSTAGATGTLPGFEYVGRFGRRTPLEGGWRPWLARWLGRDDLANVAPGVIAAAALVDSAPPTSGVLAPPPESTSWLARPVHLIAGLTSLHLDRRSILHLPPGDLESFARDFNLLFGDSGLLLRPLFGGDLLMQGPGSLTAATTEPARALVADLEASLPRGNDAKALKRLSAELEMWLHSNPLNEARRRRGELPVSTLWLWGGGRSLPGDSLAAATEIPNTHTDVAFGNDPYLAGLWRINGDRSRALPNQLTELLIDTHAQRAVVVVEVTPMLHPNPHWTVFEALAELDRHFVSPAIAALGQRAIESLVLIANDTELRLRRRDRLKLWRRPQRGIAALQVPGAHE
jgi:hypothetical protein